MAPGGWVKPILFSLVAAACASYGFMPGLWWGWRVPIVWTAASFALLALGYAGLGGRIFGKRADGRLAWWAYLLHGPYQLTNAVIFALRCALTSEAVCDEIAPGLWLGRYTRRRPPELGEGDVSVLDLTAEFPAARWECAATRYHCEPVLDACPLTSEQLHRVVDWVENARQHGAVYVHCALGHSRSATVVAAVLWQSGVVATADDALAHIRSRRQLAAPNAKQCAMLTQSFGRDAS